LRGSSELPSHLARFFPFVSSVALCVRDTDLREDVEMEMYLCILTEQAGGHTDSFIKTAARRAAASFLRGAHDGPRDGGGRRQSERMVCLSCADGVPDWRLG
jgi:hypothetical protein